MPTSPARSDSVVRSRLAFSIVGLSMAGIIAAAIVLIALSDDQTRPEMARLVFAAVLPLFGTWVGTVLAFYFARENLQAATDSTVRLTQLNNSDPVIEDVMIPLSSIKSIVVAGSTEARSLALSKVVEAMTNGGVRRMPILVGRGAAAYVFHLSTLASYAESVHKDVSALSETVGDLLASSEFRELVTAIGYVRKGSTLSNARLVLRSTAHCNDIFVTEGGGQDEPVVGWLTNTLLASVQ